MMSRDGKLPMQRAQEALMQESINRRDWIRGRIQESQNVVKFLKNQIHEREINEREQGQLVAEINGLLLDLKPGVLINAFRLPLEEIKGFEERLQKIDPDYRVVGDFAFHKKRLMQYIQNHPDLAQEAGWDAVESQQDRMKALSEIMRTMKGIDMLPQEHLAIGTLLGYPEEAVRGFAREIEIRQKHDAPSPQSLDLSAREKEVMYRDKYGLSEDDAKHLASKRRVELYLKNSPAPFEQFAAYGETSEKEKQLKESAKEISSHL